MLEYMFENNLFYLTYGKKIILFGAGGYATDYMRKYAGIFTPYCIIDNDSQKQDSLFWDVPVYSIEKLLEIPNDERFVVICSAAYKSIVTQLEELDKKLEYFIYNPECDYIDILQNSNFSNLLPIYNIGYVPGVFDLYHIGHLNLLKKSKFRCKNLIAGVLTDELVFHFKKQYPIIPFEERFEIIKSVKYVDDVVKVDFSNTIKMDAWKTIGFDCHFSGDDHLRDWDIPLKALRKVGSNMEFFKYTSYTSSTKIKEKLK